MERTTDDVQTTWFVTGAGRGMGRAVVEQLLARGHRVAATVRRPEQLAPLRATHGERLWTARLDVTDTDELRAVVDRAFADLGRIDVVVSNAGYGVFGTAEDVTDAQLERMVATNLTASMQLARAVIPHLRVQGGGALVQLSSMGGQIAFPGFSLYHAAKWGIEGFLEAVAQEVAPLGIRTVLIEPGMIRTGFFDAAERVPVSAAYRGGPADRPPIPLEEMAGDEAKVAAGIIAAGLDPAPPRRVLLASDGWRFVTEALRERLAAAEGQRDLAAQADVDGWTP